MSARILIVGTARDLAPIRARLAAEYFHVANAVDGVEAMRVAAAWQPDLVLIDLPLAGLDGIACCRRLRKEPATLHIPIVLIASSGDAGDRLRGLQAGADDVLIKPIGHAMLLARIRSLVRLRRLLDEWKLRGETAQALGLVREPTAPRSAAGARVLVIDDWEAGARTVQAALARDRLVVARARTCSDAMQSARRARLDLIVLSLSLIDEDPLRLLAALRATEAAVAIPILLILAPEERQTLMQAVELGANDWAVLPLDDDELRARARNQILRKLYQDRLRADLGAALELASSDPLTGLRNRRWLVHHLGVLLECGRDRELTALLIDVDHFKSVNDACGHAAGDAALRAVAGILRDSVRACDTVARYGGDEFVAVMPDAGRDEAARIAERLRAAVELADLRPGGSARITVSVGVAGSAGGGTAEAVLAAADRTLYAAKRTGRNRVVVAEPT